ncbi:MAG: DUF1963 domain-containing protein [Chloroflexota bacterium]|nr:MAG: DUF1963 domain-containing protein [Chloroflexota bacterium]
MEIGGIRPSESLSASWFGRVLIGSVGERWPFFNQKPMLALAQVNVAGLPFRTPGFADIDFITVFIRSDRLPLPGEQNGTSWILRAYNSLANLVPLEPPNTDSFIKPFQMNPKVVDDDFPCFDDIPVYLRDRIRNAYQENQIKNTDSFKLGGWPTLIQSEIQWVPFNQHSSKPEYVFQIDSTEKGNWMWGDSGMGYFGRDTVEGHKDDWMLSWQCY